MSNSSISSKSDSHADLSDTRTTIIIDTREQHAYGFDAGRVRSVRKALPAGDYSIEGYETTIAVERKSLNDFVSTVIRGRERFTRELQLLQSYEHACIVVEGSLRDVTSAKYKSMAHPNAIFGSVMSIIVDFGIPVYFCSDRQHALRFTEDFLVHAYRKMTRDDDRGADAPIGRTENDAG